MRLGIVALVVLAGCSAPSPGVEFVQTEDAVVVESVRGSMSWNDVIVQASPRCELAAHLQGLAFPMTVREGNVSEHDVPLQAGDRIVVYTGHLGDEGSCSFSLQHAGAALGAWTFMG